MMVFWREKSLQYWKMIQETAWISLLFGKIMVFSLACDSWWIVILYTICKCVIKGSKKFPFSKYRCDDIVFGDCASHFTGQSTTPTWIWNTVVDHTHKIHIQVTKPLKWFLSMYPQMSESSTYPVRAATPLQLLIHKEIG